MPRVSRRASLRTAALFAASFTIGIVILLAFVGFVGLADIARLVQSVPLEVLAVAIGLNLVSLLFYGLAWYTLIRSIGGRIPFATCQGIALTAIFMYYATPSGLFLEAVRVLLSSRSSNMSLGESTSTVVVHRILFTIGFISTTAIATVALSTQGPMSSTILVRLGAVLLGAIALLAVIIYLIAEVNKIERLAHRFLPRLQSAIRRVGADDNKPAEELLRTFVVDFDRGFRRIIKNRFHLLLSFALVLAYWLTTVEIMFVIFQGLRYDVSIWIVILTIAIAEFVQMTPVIIPGMLGVLESILTSVLTGFGVPLGIAASATILARVATFWFNLPVTALAAIYYGSKFAVSRMIKSAYK